jgi:hypothetical protein
MSELDTLSADAAKKTEAITSIDDEDEKERTIAKAALTIAELGM